MRGEKGPVRPPASRSDFGGTGGRGRFGGTGAFAVKAGGAGGGLGADMARVGGDVVGQEAHEHASHREHIPFADDGVFDLLAQHVDPVGAAHIEQIETIWNHPKGCVPP